MGCACSKEKLSKEDVEFLKQHTRYDEATIKEWYKGFQQDCPNGRLTPDKFVDMYKMFFPSGNAEEFCDHVFRTFDTDKNGYIDFKEFLLAIDVTSAGTPEEKLRWAFNMYDVDGNGHIDPQEMTKNRTGNIRYVGLVVTVETAGLRRTASALHLQPHGRERRQEAQPAGVPQGVSSGRGTVANAESYSSVTPPHSNNRQSLSQHIHSSA